MLRGELDRCRARKFKAIKIMHGYGSTGVGGTLRQGIRKSLVSRRKEGKIKLVVFGENWNICDALTRLVLEQCPALRGDRDLCNANPGISIVLL
jgi:hypothetical protein